MEGTPKPENTRCRGHFLMWLKQFLAVLHVFLKRRNFADIFQEMRNKNVRKISENTKTAALVHAL
jgi:hypothetical protein